MRNDIRKAIEAVRKFDKEFNACKANETDDYIILFDLADGIPPYIIDKKTMDVHQVIIGTKQDMDIAFKASVFVEDLGRII